MGHTHKASQLEVERDICNIASRCYLV